MSRYDLTNEASRANRRPTEEPVALLALLVVTPAAGPEAYAARLRHLVGEAVGVAQVADFGRGNVPTSSLPNWFLALTDGGDEAEESDELGSEGKRRYLEAREDRPWEIEDWVYCFDPDLRSWSWWDVTVSSHGQVNVWIDTKGEAHVPCEELWWAVYVSGALDVAALMLESAEVWSQQTSISVIQ